MTAFKKPLSCILAILMVIVFTAAVPISAFADSDGLGEQLTLSEEELLNKRAEGDFEYVATAYSHLSEADQALFVQLYEDDVFMDENL